METESYVKTFFKIQSSCSTFQQKCWLSTKCINKCFNFRKFISDSKFIVEHFMARCNLFNVIWLVGNYIILNVIGYFKTVESHLNFSTFFVIFWHFPTIFGLSRQLLTVSKCRKISGGGGDSNNSNVLR